MHKYVLIICCWWHLWPNRELIRIHSSSIDDVSAILAGVCVGYSTFFLYNHCNGKEYLEGTKQLLSKFCPGNHSHHQVYYCWWFLGLQKSRNLYCINTRLLVGSVEGELSLGKFSMVHLCLFCALRTRKTDSKDTHHVLSWRILTFLKCFESSVSTPVYIYGCSIFGAGLFQ